MKDHHLLHAKIWVRKLFMAIAFLASTIYVKLAIIGCALVTIVFVYFITHIPTMSDIELSREAYSNFSQIVKSNFSTNNIIRISAKPEVGRTVIYLTVKNLSSEDKKRLQSIAEDVRQSLK